MILKRRCCRRNPGIKNCGFCLLVLTLVCAPLVFSQGAEGDEGFIDGNFESAGDLLKRSGSMEKTGDEFLDAAAEAFLNPQALLEASWKVNGEVRLVSDEGNTQVEMVLAGETSPSLAQLVKFHNENATIEFDMNVLQADPDTHLEILIIDEENSSKNQISLVQYDLSNFSGENHFRVDSLKEYLTKKKAQLDEVLKNEIWGTVVFQLSGSSEHSAKIELDNLTIVY